MNQSTLLLRCILAGVFLLMGLTTLEPDSPDWVALVALTITLYTVPLLCQLPRSGWLHLAGFYWALFLGLQTLISPWVPGLKYLSLPANFSRVINVHEGIPGISGLQHITTDDHGYRVSSKIDYSDAAPYRIFAIGGSTTEEIYLDDSKTWTSQLQALLNARGTTAVEVINTGVSGLRAGNHAATLAKILPLNPDIAVFLIGANDWGHQIRRDNGSSFQRLISNHTEAFWLKNTLLGKALRIYKLSADARTGPAGNAGQVAHERGEYYTKQRGSLLRPDQRPYKIAHISNDYQRHLRGISNMCTDNQLLCVFITQPHGYTPEASAEFAASFWATPANETYTLSLTDMASVAATYNNYLLTFAIQNQHHSCDLAGALAPTAENFYDDLHYTEAGANRVAAALANCLAELPRND